jgi:SAM-dependent methyltransferase
MALPFADGNFDAVVCQFGVMFFPDKLKGYQEARRMLRPGGTYIFNVWDCIEANEAAFVVSKAVGSLFPENPPRFLERTPHGYYEIGAIRDELARAGFSRKDVETVGQRGCAASHREPAIGFCLGSPLRTEIEARDPGRLDPAVECAAAAIGGHSARDP